MISDDELLLYYYRELDAAEHARIGAVLGEQPELARRLHALVARLDAAAAMPEVPVPAHTMQRWQAALERAAIETRVAPAARRTFRPMGWPLAAAAAVAVVALAVTLQLMQPTQRIGPQVIVSNEGTMRRDDTSAYQNGLKVHLASTERRLARLGSATPEERARLVGSIMDQNRIFALAAERAGEPQLARVLRAFNPILEDLADGGSETSAADVAQLSFELRVMQARLSPDAPSSNIL